MTDSTTITDFKDAILAMEKASLTYTVWAPSIQKELTFKELNTKQQKEFFKAVVDSPFYKTHFIRAAYDILKENLVASDEVASLDNLSIIDKQVILLKTRIECFDSEYEVETDEPVESKKVDLRQLYENCKQINHPKERDIYHNGISVIVSPPSILTEYKLENELHKDIDQLDINNVTVLRNTLGELFVGELAKYITAINVGPVEGMKNMIDFLPMNFNDRIKVLNKLSNTIVQKIITYIDEVKLSLDQVTTVTLKIQDSDKEIKEKFDIDGTFFTIK